MYSRFAEYCHRFIEVFYERGYPVSVIRELLKKSGFMKVIIKSFNADKPLKQANRIFAAAYK